MQNPANSNLAAENSANPFPIDEKSRRGLYIFGVLLLFGIFAFQLWFHATRTSATIDEPPHIFAGYRYWQCGDFGVNPEHPPLLKLLAALPLVSKDLSQPSWDCGTEITSNGDSYLAGNLFLAKNNPDSVVIPARLSAALMSLLLAVLVFLAAREMFGRWEAFVALGLLAFEPNIIAHGSLVTTDMAVTATMFAAVYTLYRYRKHPTVFRFLLVGIATGATLAAKHSGILILPILFLLFVADFFFSRRMEIEAGVRRRFLRRVASFAGIIFIGFVVLWATYGFRYDAVPNDSQPPVLINDFFEGAPPEVINSPVVKTMKAVTSILPESYTVGLFYIMRSGSRPMFLFGEFYPTARWFYFPAAFSIKTSVALLVLLALSLLTIRLYREHWRESLFLLLPALVFFGVSLTSGLNIGVRHILPVYPFFIVIAAAGICYWSRKYTISRYLLIALLIFHAVAAFRTAPNYLAFANDFWGGTNNTHRLLSDSNVEWGQNYKLAREYLARKNISDCRIAAFGAGEMVRAYQPCGLMPNDYGWNFTEQIAEPVPPVVEGTFLLSVAVFPPLGGDEYAPIIQTEPVAFLGGSIFVYQGRFEVPLVAALSYAGRADQFIELKRFDEAVADGQKAVELAPDDPRPHLALGVAFSLSNRPDEARREFETTVKLAESNSSMVFEWTKFQAQNQLRRSQ